MDADAQRQEDVQFGHDLGGGRQNWSVRACNRDGLQDDFAFTAGQREAHVPRLWGRQGNTVTV